MEHAAGLMFLTQSMLDEFSFKIRKLTSFKNNLTIYFKTIT